MSYMMYKYRFYTLIIRMHRYVCVFIKLRLFQITQMGYKAGEGLGRRGGVSVLYVVIVVYIILLGELT